MTFICFCEIQHETNQTFFYRFEALNSLKFLYLHNEQWNAYVCVCVCARANAQAEISEQRSECCLTLWLEPSLILHLRSIKTRRHLSDDTECVKDSKQTYMTVPSRRLWRSLSVCWQIKRRVAHVPCCYWRA